MQLLLLLQVVTQRDIESQLHEQAKGFESRIKGKPGIDEFIKELAARLKRFGIKSADAKELNSRVAFVVAAADVKPLDPVRLFWNVPLVATSGDGFMQDFNFKPFTHKDFTDYRENRLDLLTPDERAVARKKFQVVECVAYTYKKFGNLSVGENIKQEHKPPRPFILLNYAAPQFEAEHLDVRDFVAYDQEDKTYNPRPRYAIHKHKHVYKTAIPHMAWVVEDVTCASIAEDATLITVGFQLAIKELQKKYEALHKPFFLRRRLRLSPAGLGFFSHLDCKKGHQRLGLASDSGNRLLEHLYAAAWRLALGRSYLRDKCDMITHIECNHWDGPSGLIWRDGEKITRIKDCDVLDFQDPEALYGIMNGGDAFCMVGNEWCDGSLDAKLMNMCDGRWVASPVFQRRLIDHANWIFINTQQQRLEDAVHFMNHPVNIHLNSKTKKWDQLV